MHWIHEIANFEQTTILILKCQSSQFCHISWCCDFHDSATITDLRDLLWNLKICKFVFLFWPHQVKFHYVWKELVIVTSLFYHLCTSLQQQYSLLILLLCQIILLLLDDAIERYTYIFQTFNELIRLFFFITELLWERCHALKHLIHELVLAKELTRVVK